jgi:hypothetical protein
VTGGRRRAPPIAGTALWLVLVVAGCGIGASGPVAATFPPESFGPSTGTTAAVVTTRADIALALRPQGLALIDPRVPFRPAESPRFAAAPRAVFQVVLPADPTHGFISVYEFPDPAAAAGAAGEQAAYVASGPGRVQFAPDSRFVIRQLDTTVIFFTWSPANSLDARTAQIQPALETLGIPIAVPR